jgi:N-acetylmuramoyl-L-alanine amidase CwlA
MDIQIKQGPQCHPSNCYTYRNGDIKYIVIHFTGNNGDTALNNCTFFSGANRKASANYFVGNDGIYQSVPDNWAAWAVGGTNTYKHRYCRNMNSISIEMCSRIGAEGKYYIDDDVVEQTIKLTKYLMNKYGVPVENVLRHYDVWDKKCPEPFVRQPELWENFKEILTESEDLTMSQYTELKELIEKQSAEIADLKNINKQLVNVVQTTMIYDFNDDNMPPWARPAVQAAMDCGAVQGDEKGRLGLSYKDLRAICREYRCGMYDR